MYTFSAGSLGFDPMNTSAYLPIYLGNFWFFLSADLPLRRTWESGECYRIRPADRCIGQVVHPECYRPSILIGVRYQYGRVCLSRSARQPINHLRIPFQALQANSQFILSYPLFGMPGNPLVRMSRLLCEIEQCCFTGSRRRATTSG